MSSRGSALAAAQAFRAAVQCPVQQAGFAHHDRYGAHVGPRAEPQ
ncbi:hypothetical protein [Streptomyces sp. HUAS TT7]